MKKIFMKKENKEFLCLSTVLIICFLAFCSSLFYSNTVNAKEPSNSIKLYTSIYIEPGDTLTSIAKKYQTEEYPSLLEYIEEIKYLNKLHSDKIIAGYYLLIPYYEKVNDTEESISNSEENINSRREHSTKESK